MPVSREADLAVLLHLVPSWRGVFLISVRADGAGSRYALKDSTCERVCGSCEPISELEPAVDRLIEALFCASVQLGPREVIEGLSSAADAVAVVTDLAGRGAEGLAIAGILLAVSDVASEIEAVREWNRKQRVV